MVEAYVRQVNQIPNIYELDIVKVASSLGIDQDRLLAYVYTKWEPIKCSDEKDSPSDCKR